MYLLANELAVALGLPKGTTRAVLTLEAGKMPTIDLTMYITDANGQLVLENYKFDWSRTSEYTRS
jgi:diacylglycerol kinase family enzyme